VFVERSARGEIRSERSAGAVVFRRGPSRQILYLILHSGLGHWDIPKGKIKKNEETAEAVRREVKEETGISDLDFVSGFKETIHYRYQREGNLINKWVAFLLAETRRTGVSLSFEHTEFAWLTLKESLKRLSFKNTREVLRKAHGYLKLNGYAV